MFKSNIYTPRRCRTGVPVIFNPIDIVSLKITDIEFTQINANTANITVKDVTNIKVGDKIRIESMTIDNIYLGNHIVTDVNVETKVISYKVFGISADFVILLQPGIGSVYTVPTIENSSNGYDVRFSVQSSVPEGLKINYVLNPATYKISNTNRFTPETTVTVTTNYSDTSKVFIKLVIINLTNNSTVYTDYQEVICSKSLNRSCQIISNEAQGSDFTPLTKNNSWKFIHQEYSLLTFIPYNEDDNFLIQLPSKSNSVLPNTLRPKYRITVDPARINFQLSNGFTNLDIQDIRERFYEYGVEADEQTEDPYSFVIVDIKSGQADVTPIDRIKNTVVGYYYFSSIPQPVLLADILIVDQDKAIVKVVDKHEIPDVAKLVIKHNNRLEYLGELIFIKSIYYKDTIIFTRQVAEQQIKYCGRLIPLREGLTEMSEANCE